MLLQSRKEMILCLLSTIAGILVLADEDSHVLFQPGFRKCVLQCYRERQKDPRRQVSDLQNCSERCQNRRKEDQMDVVVKNTIARSSIADQSLALSSRQRERKGLPPVIGCPASSGEKDWYPTTVNATFYQNANSSLWFMNVSWNPLNDSSGNWTGILVRFIAHYDLSTSRMGPVKCIELPKNLTSVTINISSYGWEYPGIVYVHVCALPYHQSKGVDMLSFSPVKEDPTRRPPTCKRSNSTDDVVWYPKNITVHFSNHSGNWQINISWTPFTEPNVSWTGYGFFILLNIQPGGFSSNVPCITLLKNQTFFIVDSSLGWHYPNSIWINITKLPHSIQGDFEDMTPFAPPDWSTPSPSGETTSSVTTSSPTKRRVAVRILLPAIGAFGCVLLALTVYCCHKKRRLVSPAEKPSILRFKYHAFILYSSADSEWVEGTLIQTLEKKYGLKCCIHYRNFVPGTVYTNSMVESVYNSYKNIAVTSSNFFSSPHCNFELNYALSRLSNKGDDSLIVIKRDETVDSRLPRELVNRSYIDFTRTVERESWETKLVEILKEAVLEQSSEKDNYLSMTNNNNNNNSSSEEVLISTEDADTIL